MYAFPDDRFKLAGGLPPVWQPETAHVAVKTFAWILEKVAVDTVRVVVPEIPPDVAVIVTEPTATPVARPLELIVATDVLDELQVAVEVKSCVVASDNVPVAVICFVKRVTTLEPVGVTAKEERDTDVTVKVVLSETPPHAAVMVVVPAATAVAKPLALMVATGVLEELQPMSTVTS